jgi:hypothetical protein
MPTYRPGGKLDGKRFLMFVEDTYEDWIPISAGILQGYKCTSTPGIKDDLINAGAIWVDEPLVIDRNMVSSRRPEDLPLFRTYFEILALY